MTDIVSSFCEIALCDCHRNSCLTYWIRKYPGTVRHQAITWNDIDQEPWHHMTSPGVNVPKDYLIKSQVFYCPQTWWRHQMEIFSALLAVWAGNSQVTGEFPAQRPVTRNFDVFFDLHQSKQSWSWWFETPSRSDYDVSVMSSVR